MGNALVHEDEDLAGTGVLIEHISDVAIKTIPFVVEAHVAFTVYVFHSSCQTQHGRIIISLLTTVIRSLAVMPQILTFNWVGVWIDTS